MTYEEWNAIPPEAHRIISENATKSSESTETPCSLPGLKDHQIQQLVNAVRDATSPMVPHQCLREVISRTVTEYLEQNGLRIDKA